MHEEILAAVNNRYESIRKVKRTSKECDAVEVQSCAWSSIVWPAIRRKILASLRATQAIVNHRSRSFQFLGYDVIIDEWCCPWLLEVNMSPAMARRSLEHSSMIATMSQGLVNLAVIGSSKSFQVDENGTSGKIDEDHWESLSGDDRLIEIRCEPAKPQQEPIPRSSRPKSAAGAAASRPGLSRPKSAGSTRRSLDSYKVIDTLSILSQNDKFDDDMKVVDRNIPTPRSISVITDISSRKISIDGLDEASLRQINLFVAGTTASDERMLFVDSMCNHFSACLLLQRYDCSSLPMHQM